MPHIVDTGVLVDVSRNNQAAIAFVDSLGGDWALFAITVLEFISGAKNQREVGLIDRLVETYESSRSMTPSAAARINCSRCTPSPTGFARSIRSSLIAASAVEERRTLGTKNRKHFELIDGLALYIPSYCTSHFLRTSLHSALRGEPCVRGQRTHAGQP
jgi:predicted nucleic acid-binding protein